MKSVKYKINKKVDFYKHLEYLGRQRIKYSKKSPPKTSACSTTTFARSKFLLSQTISCQWH